MSPLATAVVIVALAAEPVAAQGRGMGGKKGGPGPVNSGSAASAATPGLGVREFGSWLDDASLLAPGEGWTAISFGRFRTASGHQTDFPVVVAGFGLAPRAQFGITVPYYRSRYSDGTSTHGVGDVYFNGKFAIVDPATHARGFGVALSPAIELLDQSQSARGRFAWAIPLNMELRRARYRLFGSTGYFSRGALFASTAVEVPLNERLVATGAISLTRSTRGDAAADALRLPKGRSDITAAAAYFLTPSIAIFGGTGRTISSVEAGGTSLMLNGGVSLSFAPRPAP